MVTASGTFVDDKLSTHTNQTRTPFAVANQVLGPPRRHGSGRKDGCGGRSPPTVCKQWKSIGGTG